MLGSKDDDGSLVSLTSNDNTWIPSIGKENGTTSRSRGKLSSSKLVWRLTIYVRVCVSVPLLRKTYANECLKQLGIWEPRSPVFLDYLGIHIFPLSTSSLLLFGLLYKLLLSCYSKSIVVDRFTPPYTRITPPFWDERLKSL